MLLGQFSLKLQLRAFIRLCIQQRTQAGELAHPERQQWPQTVAVSKPWVFRQRHQQVYTTNTFLSG
ncbi:hypothetical protein D3C81_1966430 [compost metagenome]